jgi:hypothetical protein
MEENQPQKVNSKSINTIKILICPIWAFEMILKLQVGFAFIYELIKSKRYGNFLSILGCYAYGLSMDITIYCFIVF